MSDQLDLFRQPAEPEAPVVDPDPEPQPTTPRRTQLTELPGATFQDIFVGPPSLVEERRVIAGVDISTKAVHVVSIPEDTNHAQLHVVRLDTELGDAITRLRRMRDLMPARTAWEDAGCTLIAVERPFHRSPGIALMMAVYGGLLQLLPAEVPLLELAPQQWRKECGLPTRGDDVKAAAIRFAREQWTDPPDAIDDNAADAFSIAWAAREIDLRRAIWAAA